MNPVITRVLTSMAFPSDIPKQPARQLLRPLHVLITCFVLAGCVAEQPVSPVKKPDQPLQVLAFQLEPRPWSLTINSYGAFESAEKVSISLDYAGTVKKVRFREGESIEAGQTLIVMDDRKQALRLKRADANVASAEAELDKVQGTYRRHRELQATGALSQDQYTQSEANFQQAKAVLAQAVADRALASQQLRETRVISPVRGIVNQRDVDPGQTVLAGVKLASVQVTDVLRVVTYVAEDEVNLLKVGDEASITSPAVPGRTYFARIELLGSSADPHTGNFVVKLTVENDDSSLREGMSARISLTGAQYDNVLMIPRTAIVDRHKRRVVFRIVDGRAEEVEPVLGIGSGDQLPVLAGLAAMDQLVNSKLELVTDGKRVEVYADNEIAP